MPAVKDYHVLFYGGPNGYQTNRAQIALYNASGTVIAYLRFEDPNMAFPSDSESKGVIYMHLPSSQLCCVLDVLRNEDPINVYFVGGHAFLGTSKEPVGEGE